MSGAVHIPEEEALRELGLLYNHAADDSRQFTRWQMLAAMQHGYSLASKTEPVMFYRGWQIEEDRSCLDVNSTWRAFAPDYDPEVCKFNTWAAARTYKVLTAEIDLAIEERNA